MTPTEQPTKSLVDHKRELEQAIQEHIKFLLAERVRIEEECDERMAEIAAELKDLGYHNTRSRVAKDGGTITIAIGDKMSESPATPRKRAVKKGGE